MNISDVMTRDVEIARPTDTIQAVAQKMASGDFGFMPVCDGRKIQGVITDRDLAVRAVAEGKSCDTPVSEIMSEALEWRYDDEPAKDVLACMAEKQIRRLPIVNRDKELVGVVSLGDLALSGKDQAAGDALESISRKG